MHGACDVPGWSTRYQHPKILLILKILVMKSEKQNLARDLYLHTLRTQQEIADILDVNRRTVYLWIKNGRWEEMKIASRQAPKCLIQNIYNHIDALEQNIRRRPVDERCPTKDEVEMLRKLVNLVPKMGDLQSVGNYIQAYEHLIRHIANSDHELSKKITRITDEIITAYTTDKDWDLRENQEDITAKLKKMKEEDEEFARTMAAENEPDGAKGDKNGIFCDNPENNNNSPKPAPNKPNEEINNGSGDAKYPISDVPANGTFPPIPDSDNDIDTTVLYYASLAPDMRPSPHRKGNTLWVNEIDDVERRLTNLGTWWGERKIGDRIRRNTELK
jgi:DNA-binding XRE family transcriptional regulator